MMLRLLNDSLDLARIEAGKLELESTALDLHALVRDVADLAGPLARAKGVGWDVARAADAPRWVHGDAVRIKQIVLNLVNNAIKFTDSGTVSLALGRGPDGSAQFRVGDSGPGISAADQQRLFRRFEQTDRPQRHGGSGLGLAICRELVTRMHGEILLDSGTGNGSMFTVTLPLAHCAAGEIVENAASLPAPMTPRCLLLVEDDPTVAAVIIGLLGASGHDVRHVPHALAALSEIATAKYAAVLIDLDLPGVDGLALARMIRAGEAGTARLPLIGISARCVGDEEALCLAAGMDAFLRKPVTAATLDAYIGSIVDKP
jgi:CheY-like chemotaxis protein/anti-sigma regulatory factor (Ser/Thr protein kinase)